MVRRVRNADVRRPYAWPRTPENVLSRTGGSAGRLLSVRRPWPWMGAENVDGRAVGYGVVSIDAKVVDMVGIEAVYFRVVKVMEEP